MVAGWAVSTGLASGGGDSRGMRLVWRMRNAAYLTGACTLTPANLKLLASPIPQVQYLKEEAPVLPQTISNILQTTSGSFKGIFGGGGARYFIDELNRGGAGNMPACEWV